MSALELLSQPVWQQVCWTLLHFVWQGAAIGAALLVALAVLRGASSRYLAALAALCAMIACPLMTAAWLWQPAAEVATISREAAGPQPASFLGHARPAGEGSAFDALQPYIVLVWLTGVLALGSRLVMSYVGVRRLRASAAPLEGALLPLFHKLTRQMRMGGNVHARVSPVVREALVVGLWRPLVLVPATWITELPTPALEAVLAHELAHIRRHDLWVNLLQRVAETLLFYHPAVWYVSRVLRVEREKCCDELAVAATGARLAYVEALQLVAQRRLAASPSVWAAAIGGTRTMNLLDRVRNVLGQRPQASSARYWPVGLAVLLLPLGLWCAAVGFAPAANADDDEKERAAATEKDGERKDGDRKDGERKDGEKDGDRKEGDRERPEARRDGDRERPEARRDGDRERPGPRDGDRPGPRGPRDGDRPFPPHEGLGQAELLRAIRELHREVAELRREVHELREGRGANPLNRHEHPPISPEDRARLERLKRAVHESQGRPDAHEAAVKALQEAAHEVEQKLKRKREGEPGER